MQRGSLLPAVCFELAMSTVPLQADLSALNSNPSTAQAQPQWLLLFTVLD